MQKIEIMKELNKGSSTKHTSKVNRIRCRECIASKVIRIIITVLSKQWQQQRNSQSEKNVGSKISKFRFHFIWRLESYKNLSFLYDNTDFGTELCSIQISYCILIILICGKCIKQNKFRIITYRVISKISVLVNRVLIHYSTFQQIALL